MKNIRCKTEILPIIRLSFVSVFLVCSALWLPFAASQMCCSQSLDTCLEESADNAWCIQAEENCLICSGLWLDSTTFDTTCVPRWKGCTTTEECCEPAVCMQLDGYIGCELEFPTSAPATTVLVDSGPCCSQAFDSCMELDEDNEWCGVSEENCLDCNARWLDASTFDSTCVPRWQACIVTADCCGPAECLQLENYIGCDLLETTSVGTTQEPTVEPTSTTTPLDPEYCCSQTFNTCLEGEENEWCNESSETCEECNAVWMNSNEFNSTCVPRWISCESTSDCCGSGQCLELEGYKGCDLSVAISTPVTNPSSSLYCCSQSFESCLQEDETEWCSQNEDNCIQCSALWLESSFSSACTPRWQRCMADDDCCEPALCLELNGYKGCDIASSCCSYDFQTCFDDVSGWCHESNENCENICKGHWINQEVVQTCSKRWNSCETSECCGELECINGVCERPNCCVVSSSCSKDWTCNYSEIECSACGGFWISQTNVAETDGYENQFCDDSVQGGCFMGSLGFTMHQGAGIGCREQCALVPGFLDGWSCGPCPKATIEAGVATTEVPSRAPSSLVPTQIINPSQNESPSLNSGEVYVTAEFSEIISLPKPLEPDLTFERADCPHLVSGLKNWHDPETWTNGEVPSTGEDATVFGDVLLSQSVVERLGIISIPKGSSLTVSDVSGGVTVNTTGMDVKGLFSVGSATCRIKNAVTITLHGDRPSDIISNPRVETYKGLSVTGTLELHGKRYFRSWTRLSRTAKMGDGALFLQNKVNWNQGQQIVLVTTALKDSREWHQNEILEIESLETNPPSGVGSVIYLKSKVKYDHIANTGYQAEVALLERSITIQGSEGDSNPIDMDPLTCQGLYYRYGDNSAPCPFSEITGFGGHVIIHQGGRAYVEGVEFYRMGQTNVLGRYPIHFHLLGDTCNGCYVSDCSFHRSFYRCVSIHGSSNITVSENVAYDVTGYCYYLEDGVEEDNTFSFNLAAHIHAIGPNLPGASGQTTDVYQQNNNLTLPADVTASGFYITNIHNNIIGNAASGGWAGFAFPVLPRALQSFRRDFFRPSAATGLTIDGNSAHSTGWWWEHGTGFYFGGALYYNANDVLEYNPGRNSYHREPCYAPVCDDEGCSCPIAERSFIRMTNTKSYLVAGVGLNSWSGVMEIVGYESHDNGLSLESLADAFWISEMLAVCRTGSTISVPFMASLTYIAGDGFYWYDTGQEHIITQSTFRSCGYRSQEFNQYDQSEERGCGESERNGCKESSTVFGFLTHSDQFTPEIMQGTRDLSFENCGRRFSLDTYGATDTVSGRGQNWLDTDGSVSGLGVRTLISSGYESAESWWSVEDEVVYDPQGPLRFIKAVPSANAPTRNLGHLRMLWDDSKHSEVGSSVCGNGNNVPCPALGFVRHAGKYFSSGSGLAITARGDIVGPVGGFGWIVKLEEGAPRILQLEQIEVLPNTPMLISIAYPLGTRFSVSVNAPSWCNDDMSEISCKEEFSLTDSVQSVRTGPGNQYFVDSDGVLTFRVVQTAQSYVGKPEWFIPSTQDPNLSGAGFALGRFERDGVYLPSLSYGPYMTIEASCEGDGPYCTGQVFDYDPDVCSPDFKQRAYDHCCSLSDDSLCEFASRESNR